MCGGGHGDGFGDIRKGASVTETVPLTVCEIVFSVLKCTLVHLRWIRKLGAVSLELLVGLGQLLLLLALQCVPALAEH